MVDFFNPHARGGTDVIGAYQKGQQFADEQRQRGLIDAISQLPQQTQLSSSPEFNQLLSANPQMATQIQQARLQNVQSVMGLDDFRTKSLFNDAKTAQALMGASPKKALDFLSRRAQIISQTGGNPSDTLEVANLIQSGDIKGAKDLLSSVVTAGEQAGVLQSDKPDKKSAFKMSEGGLVFDPNTGTFKRDPVAQQVLEEIASKKQSGQTLTVKDKQSLNKDVTGIIKETVKIRNFAAELDKLKGRGSAAAKLGAVFKFMKSLDPTSVVRETEQGQVYAAEGAAAQIAGQINSILGEGKLTEKGFQDLVDTAKVIANSSIESSGREVSTFFDTFEDSLPSSFVEKSKLRVPKPFEVEQGETVQSQQGETVQAQPEIQSKSRVQDQTKQVGKFSVRVINNANIPSN